MTEILAPCGDFEALRGAIAGGADAVYLGLKQFSARASAGNFSSEELILGTKLAHAHGVKVYVALNTLMTDRELEESGALIAAAADANVDGVIVQDLGLFSLLKQTSNLPLHFSTQGGVYNAEGAEFAKSLGFVRAVLSRETEEGEIERIKSLGLEVEVFVHGALCTAFSGNCYFSSFLSRTSGNRGRCLQPCRLKYDCLADGKSVANGYLLSSKDECLLGKIGSLARSGADSLKIEGRLKRAEYAAETSRIYSETLKLGKLSAQAADSLKKLFNRGGFCEGLATCRDGVICKQVQGHSGLFCGKILRVSCGRAEASEAFAAGDGFKVFRSGFETGSASSEGGVSLSVKGDVRPGDELHITTDVRQLGEIRKYSKRIPVRVRCFARSGEPIRAMVEVPSRKIFIELSGETVDEGRKPMGAEDFEACFRKTGETEFELETFDCETENAFLPKSVLNDFRRRCYETLFERLAESETRTFDAEKFNALIHPIPAKTQGKGAKIAIFSKFGGAEVRAAEEFDSLVYSPFEFFTEAFFETLDRMNETGKPVYLDIPLFLYREDYARFEAYSDRYAGVYARNPAAATLAKRTRKPLLLSPDCNVFNAKAARTYREFYDCGIVFSEELHEAQARDIRSEIPDAFVLAAGRQSFMRLNHCPMKEALGGTCSKCRFSEGMYEYRNEYGQKFPISRVKVGENCYFTLYNGEITFKNITDSAVSTIWDFSRVDGEFMNKALARVCGEGAENGNTTQGHWQRTVL